MRRKSCINLAKKLKSPPNSMAQVVTEDYDEKGARLIDNKDDIDKRNLRKAIKQLHKMSNEELEALLSSDNFVLDCVLDQIPMVKKLQLEHDHLQKRVNNLANFNYAREPEFVRDRTKLREILDDVAALRRRVSMKHIQPILEKLNSTQSKLSMNARKFEEQSERLAQDFLDGNKNYDGFIEQYIKLRKEAGQKRILADKLAKEKNRFIDNVPEPLETNSPIPTPRQRKRVSFNK